MEKKALSPWIIVLIVVVVLACLACLCAGGIAIFGYTQIRNQNVPTSEVVPQDQEAPQTEETANPEEFVPGTPEAATEEPAEESTSSCEAPVRDDMVCAKSSGLTICWPKALASGFDSSYQAEEEPGAGPNPTHDVYTLSGYPVQNDIFQPEIKVYDLETISSANMEQLAPMISDLKDLVENQPCQLPDVPFMPVMLAAQAVKGHPVYSNGACGTVEGVGFVTLFAQDTVKINNSGLVYSFQGITKDEKYWISIILPIHQADLPANSSRYTGDFDAYKNYADQVGAKLSDAANSSFTPNMDLIEQIEIYE